MLLILAASKTKCWHWHVIGTLWALDLTFNSNRLSQDFWHWWTKILMCVTRCLESTVERCCIMVIFQHGCIIFAPCAKTSSQPFGKKFQNLRQGGKNFWLTLYIVQGASNIKGIFYWCTLYNVQCESKIFTPLTEVLEFFPKRWEYLIKILNTCYSFILTLNCKILFNYPQLWQSYAVFSATTQWKI